MMTEHSLRLTALVFIIRLLFAATFTLDCSGFIGFCRKLYLISSVTQNEHLFTFEQSFYAELQHFPGGSYLNGEIFICLNQHKTVLSRLLKRGFSCWIRSTHMELLLNRSRKFLFQFLPTTTHFELSFNFWHHIFFRQHLHNLISEGKTNLWAEYNDGCVQRVASIAFCLLSICYIILIFL